MLKLKFKIVKIRQKVVQKYWHLLYWIHYNSKMDDYENVGNINPSYLIIHKASGYFKEKTEINA